MTQKNCTTTPRRTKTKYIPIPLFQNGADLPLFTQSADVIERPAISGHPGDPRRRYFQLSLFEGVTCA